MRLLAGAESATEKAYGVVKGKAELKLRGKPRTE